MKLRELVGNKAEGRISKGVLQENKVRQTFRKTNISYPLETHKHMCEIFVFRKICVFCFLVTPVLRFALLHNYRRTQVFKVIQISMHKICENLTHFFIL